MRPSRRWIPSVRSAVLPLALALGSLPALPSPALAATPSLKSCLSNTKVVRVTGTHRAAYKVSSPAAGTTIDARAASFRAFPSSSLYPFSIGKKTAPARLCVVGGIVTGTQSRTLTWDQMKNAYDGDGLRIGGNSWYVVDGLRVDNVSDGVSPRGTVDRLPPNGDGFVMRNLYMTYIRDDCVENDEMASGLIVDSLFDGCYTGISERPSKGSPLWNHPASPRETLTLDRVLLRLQALPGVRGSNNPKALGHGKLFKWSSVANRLVIRDSVFLVERKPNGGSWTPFPPGTRTERVTLVWRGAEPFTWSVPAGTKVTRDKSVWDRARARWLARHGCSSFTRCTKLHTPDRY